MNVRQVSGRRVQLNAGKWKPHPDAIQFWLEYFGYPRHPKPTARVSHVINKDDALISWSKT